MLDGNGQKKIILSRGGWKRFFPLLNKLKVIVFKVILLLLGIIFSLIILEISARIFLKVPSTPAPFRFSPLFQFEHVPNYSYKNVRPEFNVEVHYNSSGLRDKEYPLEKNKPVLRTAVVGDSYVEGAEVALEETFVKRLGRLLNEGSSTDKFEVINFGVLSYNSDHEYVLIKEGVSKYKPDLVILVFFFNDIDAFNNSSLIKINGENIISQYPLKPEVQPPPSIIRQLLTKIISHSVFWDYLVDYKLSNLTPEVMLKFQKMKTKIFGETKEDVSLKKRLKFRLNRRKFTAFSINSFIPSKSDELRIVWRSEKILLDKMKKVVDGWGGDFIVVLATAPFYYRPDAIKDFAARYNISYSDFDPTLPNKTMSEILTELEIPYLDLLPVLSNYEKENRVDLHYKYDIHWNSKGHEVVANSLFKFLSQLGYLSAND